VVLAAGCGEDAPPNAAPPEDAEPTTELAITQLGAQTSAAPFSVLIPENTIGWTLLARVPLQSGIETVLAPDGQPVVVEHTLPGTKADFSAKPLFAEIPEPVDVVLAVPMSDAPPALPLMVGPWTITLAEQLGSVATAPDVRLVTRITKDGIFQGGAVDVNVFIAGNSTKEDYMADVIAQAFHDFGGLNLGDVRYETLPATAIIIDDEQEFRDLLLATPLTAATPAINVLAVGDTTAIGGVAKTGGTPGLALWHGTILSGIALQISGDKAFDALTLRHEAGHFAGLLHTTDENAETHDALADTPMCANPAAPQDCLDATNIMFPIPNDVWSSELSPSQAAVLQGSAIYRDLVDGPISETQPLDASAAMAQLAHVRRDVANTLTPGLHQELFRFCSHGRTGPSPEFRPVVSELERDVVRSLAQRSDIPAWIRRNAQSLLDR